MLPVNAGSVKDRIVRELDDSKKGGYEQRMQSHHPGLRDGFFI